VLESESLQLAIHESVQIISYDPGWPEKYELEKDRLLSLFPEAFLAIEHIGSTAVPQMAAKPIIDLLGGVRSIAEADLLLPALYENGYTTSVEFNASLGDRRWLMRHAGGHRTHHLHLVIHRDGHPRFVAAGALDEFPSPLSRSRRFLC
jgi:GrpB-like predicted nucleotidyltransferase (UPF0157 family)